ncbi:MAG: hypothetical protein K6G45_02845 [Lachnospiraceae bacterium]|nr:hypothetical protein [Lachnospiraceae bacterium]
MKRILRIPLIMLKRVAYILMSAPVVLFAIGWLKWYWASLVIIATVSVFICSCMGKKNRTDETLCISVSALIIVAFIILIWVWLSGAGGFWGQSDDYEYRNAIFRDLILRKWPVIYEKTGHALVYYIGFWLFPALFGKLALLFGAGDAVAFNVGSVAVFLWTFVMLMIVALLIINYLHAFTRKKQIFAILLFIFFSGMDLICMIGGIRGRMFHLEWWAMHYQYSSFTTCLFWVYNQALPAWLCFMCLLHEKKLSSYVFIGMVCLFCAPLPFVGFFIYAVALGVIRAVDFFRHKQAGKLIWELFSLPNILSVLIIFPIIAAYLLSNEAIHGAGSIQVSEKGYYIENDEGEKDPIYSYETDSKGNQLTYEEVEDITNQNLAYGLIAFVCLELLIGLIILFKRLKKKFWYYLAYLPVISVLVFAISKFKDVDIYQENMLSTYFSFICVEFLLYMIMIFKKYRKEPLYYVTVLSLMVIPFIRIGYSMDFSMRASIPGLVMVYLMTARFLMEDRDCLKIKSSLPRLCYVLLVVFLCIGAATPICEMFRNTRQVYLHGIRYEGRDDVYTLGCDGPYDEPGQIKTYGNFVAVEPENQTFFKVFGRMK